MDTSQIAEVYMLDGNLTPVVDNATAVFNYLICRAALSKLEPIIPYLTLANIDYGTIFRANKTKLFTAITTHFGVQPCDLLLILKHNNHLDAARDFDYHLYC